MSQCLGRDHKSLSRRLKFTSMRKIHLNSGIYHDLLIIIQVLLLTSKMNCFVFEWGKKLVKAWKEKKEMFLFFFALNDRKREKKLEWSCNLRVSCNFQHGIKAKMFVITSIKFQSTSQVFSSVN
jgi:hypothetical protein